MLTVFAIVPLGTTKTLTLCVEFVKLQRCIVETTELPELVYTLVATLFDKAVFVIDIIYS